MIDVLGPFLLILLFAGGSRGEDMTVQVMRDRESCESAIVQLEPYSRSIAAICIAATTIKETPDD